MILRDGEPLDKFALVLAAARLNTTGLSADCRMSGASTEARWRAGGKHHWLPTKSQCFV